MKPGGPDQDDSPAQPMFGFPAPAAHWDGLIEGPHNAAALRLAGRPEDWATPVLCIIGPAKCGLTYLAQAWAVRFGAELIEGPLLAKTVKSPAALAGAHVVIDDADLSLGRNEDVLVSLVNLIGTGGGRLLLTAHRAPSQWRVTSPDLRSRLKALPVGEIGMPDEDGLRARLVLAAERRFLRLSQETLNYLVPRLELAYDAVESFMDRLSASVSDADRAPSLPLARSVLERMGRPDGDEEG